MEPVESDGLYTHPLMVSFGGQHFPLSESDPARTPR